MPERCLSPDTVLLLMEGGCPASLRAEAERHLADCSACRARLEQAWRLLDADSGLDRGAARELPRPRRRRWAAVATFVAAVAGAAWMASEVLGPGDPARLSRGALPGTLKSGVGEARVIKLPDGSRLVLRGDTEAGIIPERTGERAHLRLDRGDLEADVSRRTGLFRVSAQAGEVDVLGTRFRARAFVLRDPAGRGKVPCLCVEVHEGIVRVRNAHGSLPVAQGGRGLSVAGAGAPVLGEVRETCDDLLEAFARKLGQADPGNRKLLLAATLWGRSLGWDWERALAAGRTGLREAAVVLLGMRCADEAGECRPIRGRLERLSEGDPDDPCCRRAREALE